MVGCYRHDIEQLLCFSWSHQQNLCFRLPAAHLDHGWVLVWSSTPRLGELHRQENSQPCMCALTHPLHGPTLLQIVAMGPVRLIGLKLPTPLCIAHISSPSSATSFPCSSCSFSYISITNRVKRVNALAAGDLTDHQRKMERDVTIVSLQRSVSAMLIC